MRTNMSPSRARIVHALIVLGLIASLAALSGCAQQADAPASRAVEQSVAEAPAAEPALPEGAPSDAVAGSLPSFADRMLIRTADLALVVGDTQSALVHIRSIVGGLEGYVAGTSLWQADNQMRGTVTIRVPAESFDAAMDQLKALAVEVQRENVSSQDVTEEYTDLSARLRNLEATETELLALLTDVRERMRNAEDVLAVHRELTAIRGEIEQTKGRMQYLERLTALATINLELIPEEEVEIVAAGWQPGRTLQEALRALVNAGQFLVEAAIWVVIFILPVLAILAAPVVLMVWGVRRWRRARAARKAA